MARQPLYDRWCEMNPEEGRRTPVSSVPHDSSGESKEEESPPPLIKPRATTIGETLSDIILRTLDERHRSRDDRVR